MRELISSLMRFSGAVTLFGLEQVQNAVGAPADTQAAIVQLRQTLDSMSETLTSKLDDSKKAALTSMSSAQNEMLGLTFDAMDSVNLSAAGEFMNKTGESLSGVMGRSSAKEAGAA